MTFEELGAALCAERERRGLSLDDVAAHLKISTRLIQALGWEAQIRGTDATGLAWVEKGHIGIRKAPCAARRFAFRFPVSYGIGCTYIQKSFQPLTDGCLDKIFSRCDVYFSEFLVVILSLGCHRRDMYRV